MIDIKILYNLAKESNWDTFFNLLKDNDDIDVNIRDDNNNYLINYAIIQNNIEIVSLLINKGAKLDIVDTDDRSILYIPIKYGFNKILDLLLHFNKITIGISLIDIKDNNNNIPIHYAIINKNIYAIDKLIEYESNVNIKDIDGNNSLHLAIMTKDIEICNKILNTNININNRNNLGETALHIAISYQLNKITELLIKNNIDINIQNNIHEFTPLHYAVNLNYINLVKILLDNKNININIQDYLGNTVLHYSLIEKNFEIMELLLKNNDLNFNLYNLDNKIPLHYLFEKYEKIKNNSIINNYLNLFILNSNLNFQDNSGITCLFLINKFNIWKEFYDILKVKKLNIFIKNKENQRPIDLINKNDINEYLKLITTSYLFLLKNNNKEWSNEWENICSKDITNLTDNEKNILSKLSNKKTTNDINICYDIIFNKLNELILKKELTCNDTSYPRKNTRCDIKIENIENKKMYYLFTGISFDILIGLIYLLNKHKSTCSVLNKNVDNKINKKYNMYNFEIIWNLNKLELSDNFFNLFVKCKNRFTIIPVGIELKIGNHANYLIYDKKLNEIERFEPYGSNPPPGFNYNPKSLDDLLEYKFKNIIKNIKYIRPSEYLPKIGLQYLESIELNKKYIYDPEGYCAVWAIWYTDMRITYADIDRKKLIKYLINVIKENNISFKELIRNYSFNIVKIRDSIFDKANININDWINDQFNPNQLNIINSEISNIILSLIH